VKKFGVRQLALAAVLVAVAVVLSIAERWIPLELLVPVPGVKLGLANIVTLFALFYLGPVLSFAIVVVRCLLAASVIGITSLAFSLSGGLLACAAMLLMKQAFGRGFSLFGISMGGAVAHNIGQVAVASLMLGDAMLFTYLPALMLTGLATGILTAAVSAPLFSALEKSRALARYIPSGGRDRGFASPDTNEVRPGTKNGNPS
jgi:heptaprenyl diphosphate synthase